MAKKNVTPTTIYPDCTQAGKPVGKGIIERWLADAPPWRAPGPEPDRPRANPKLSSVDKGKNYVRTSAKEQDAVNIALLLRRPLLITGDPGLGKSTLAYSIAYRLGLGEPLRWEINSRTTLQDGLYRYDAVGHLHGRETSDAAGASIADHIALGPLGTAMAPHARPRVLLIDELDKSSYDLPNDLLHIFEEARFRIPELRQFESAEVGVQDGPEHMGLTHGVVETFHHPVVVITSNGEREFPPAFLRRCVELELVTPEIPVLKQIVARHLHEKAPPDLESMIEELGTKRTDYVLQAAHLTSLGLDIPTIKATLDGTVRR